VEEISHNIERHIMSLLARLPSARFAQMRPAGVESNLYAYHLKNLIKNGYISREEKTYTLTPKGMQYIDRFSMRNAKIVKQSKITAGTIVKNELGEILLTKRNKHPFFGFYSLPLSKTYIDEHTIVESAERIAKEYLGVELRELKHVGDCYVRTTIDGVEISNILSHIFYKDVKKRELEAKREAIWNEYLWVKPSDLHKYLVVPGAEDIVETVLKSREFFFREFAYDIREKQ